MPAKQFVIEAINRECERQIEIWGEQHHNNLVWLLILLEEVGEVCESIIKFDPAQTNTELIQCVAVIASWLGDDSRDFPDQNDIHYRELVSDGSFIQTVKSVCDIARQLLSGIERDPPVQ